MATFHYNGLTASVIGGGEGEDERRMLSWQQQDQMGRTTLLRSYTPGGDEWTLAAEISLTYDAADRLTQVYRRDGGERRWQRTSSIDYDRSLSALHLPDTARRLSTGPQNGHERRRPGQLDLCLQHERPADAADRRARPDELPLL